jgi:hypothetical protein
MRGRERGWLRPRQRLVHGQVLGNIVQVFIEEKRVVKEQRGLFFIKSRAETNGLIKSIGSNQVARRSILQVVTQKKRREALMRKVSVR